MQEGKALFEAASGKITKSMGVFYNPMMKTNRDMSVLLLNALGVKQKIALPLAASGIRGIRFLLEIKPKPEVHFNDLSKEAVKKIKKNLTKNKIKSGYELHNKDANLFLLESDGFSYIDIDPFGSPNPFLDSSIRRISRHGVLAVTATDTAPLCGTYPKACKRKYWSTPKRNGSMHETGIRILIRKVQLIGAQYEKALIPCFCFYKDHYFRLFFYAEKSKTKVDQLLKQHGMHDEAGPLWLGELWDKKLVSKMSKLDPENKFLQTIKQESKIKSIGIVQLGELGKQLKTNLPKREDLIAKLKKAGFKASVTHFTPEAIKVDGKPNYKKLI